jgi:hypothetical protein
MTGWFTSAYMSGAHGCMPQALALPAHTHTHTHTHMKEHCPQPYTMVQTPTFKRTTPDLT